MRNKPHKLHGPPRMLHVETNKKRFKLLVALVAEINIAAILALPELPVCNVPVCELTEQEMSNAARLDKARNLPSPCQATHHSCHRHNSSQKSSGR